MYKKNQYRSYEQRHLRNITFKQSERRGEITHNRLQITIPHVKIW